MSQYGSGCAANAGKPLCAIFSIVGMALFVPHAYAEAPSASRRAIATRYVLPSLVIEGEAARSHGPVPSPACQSLSGSKARVVDGSLEVFLGAGVGFASGEPAGAPLFDTVSGSANCRATIAVAFPAGRYPERLTLSSVAGLVKAVGSRIAVRVGGSLEGVPLAEASREFEWGRGHSDPLLSLTSVLPLRDGSSASSGDLRRLVCAARGARLALRLEATVEVEKAGIFEEAIVGLEGGDGGDVRLLFSPGTLLKCP